MTSLFEMFISIRIEGNDYATRVYIPIMLAFVFFVVWAFVVQLHNICDEGFINDSCFEL
jgi:nucleoside recognition membrane protein YjiH